MIARLWRAPADHLERLLPGYAGVPGNHGAWCLHCPDDSAAAAHLLTFWTDTRALTRLAAVESQQLAGAQARVSHYAVRSDHASAPSAPSAASAADGERAIARVWEGIVPIATAAGYWRYLVDFGFRDYRAYAGFRSAHLLCRTERPRVHLYLLSFWSSRDAIVAYAGTDISRAHYYAYDLACLIDPSPTVEHYVATPA